MAITSFNYTSTGTIDITKEPSLQAFYEDIGQCKRLGKKELKAHFRELREVNYNIWEVAFGNTPTFLEHLVVDVIPTYLRENKLLFRNKDQFIPKVLPRLRELTEKYKASDSHLHAKKDRKDLQEIKRSLARELTLKVDGSRAVRQYVIDLLEKHGGVASAPVQDRKKRLEVIRAKKKEELRLRNIIFSSTVRLAIKLAASYYGRHQENLSFNYSDIIQHACIGLIDGINRFDPERGFAFSTYASYWIMQGMRRAYQNNNLLVRRPAHLNTLQRKVDEFRSDFWRKHERDPTEEELWKGLRGDTHNGKGISLTNLKTAKISPKRARSLNHTISTEETDNEVSFQDLLPETFPDPEACHDYNRVIHALRRLVKRSTLLSPRERHVLKGYFLHEGTTLKDIGDEYLLSRERIRQITLDAIRKLRREFHKEGWDKEEVLAILERVKDRYPHYKDSKD